MRRLGFLEVLLSSCISENQNLTAEQLGEKLSRWSDENQEKFLNKLAKQRGKEHEVGSITKRTASRFVKFATELGLLTSGSEKQLTDWGRLF